jgi:hypothetical protein
MNDRQFNQSFDQPAQYCILVDGRLPEKAVAWFPEMVIETKISKDGQVVTCLVGEIQDQAALHGLLGRIRDLGINLIRVERQ